MEPVSRHISIDRDAVSAFCRRHHITWLLCLARSSWTISAPSSDVDVLVEFRAGHVPGFNFVSIEREFSDCARPACRYGDAKVSQSTAFAIRS
jgi:predicted nucleotidyltransferase